MRIQSTTKRKKLVAPWSGGEGPKPHVGVSRPNHRMDEYGRGGADRPTDLSTHAAASWLHRAAEDLATRINKRGMTMTSEDAEIILAERHSTIARQLGVGDLSVRSYFDSPGLDDLADRLVATFDSPWLHSFGVNPLDGYQLVLRSCPSPLIGDVPNRLRRLS
jgi:hypothetical protein